ncbi:TetR family transcriptional regulator [Tamaricihabitans halophyticus]|uniref:TetR family transcriptional regulator n=1 Tax=Tamaricihabitans halophyticus TaxID=1262583 RepID=A0A4R2QYY1_9PSEU|nr:TetR/AcrR family transcriptional regulator [Tamaricihabitans halophyticus]TCP54897.1 TetR family transcriptional regulator [Tamaricihabitans halophyticus]
MPKIVDHVQRRAELAHAVWRVIQRDGIEHASVRTVAAESGWSTGALRHYFPTSDALLGFAMELCFDWIAERLNRLRAEQAARPAGTTSSFQRIRELAHIVLPLDDQRLLNARVLMSFMPRSLVHEALHEQERRGTGMLRMAFTEVFEVAERAGELVPGARADRQARQLLALLDGLNTHHLLAPRDYPVSELVELVDAQLRATFAAQPEVQSG